MFSRVLNRSRLYIFLWFFILFLRLVSVLYLFWHCLYNNLYFVLFLDNKLHWIVIICNRYHPWSFICSPGWVQIKCEFRILSQFAFNLNPDWELPAKKQPSQPLKDGVRDMLVKHHLFSWDLWASSSPTPAVQIFSWEFWFE